MSSIFAVVPIVFGLFALVPAIALPSGSFATYISYAFDILDVILYILPAPTVLAIFTIIMSLQAWRIIVSVIRTIWDILPIA